MVDCIEPTTHELLVCCPANSVTAIVINIRPIAVVEPGDSDEPPSGQIQVW